ncbi:hypothetical protein [Streptomyces acidicola]|uniref:Uncharacterized protein n=1 Tax=Streptomyces acidicola TaxID=2596892 RepID=A0A5N8X782_9ACTN|nr:hypothetical protein [Streptomyces acidicola]MPY54475.1 hypothetical protein [Streptomyces acidicola]
MKSALNRTRRAKDRLGRSDRDDRRRRDLDNNARRMREAYARRRDLLKKQQQRRAEQKRQEKQRKRENAQTKENSQQSKNDRLDKIVARIRPQLMRLLQKGIPESVFKAMLVALRAWHRLSELAASGSPSITVDAVLNPRRRAARARAIRVAGGLARTPEQILSDSPDATREEILSDSEAQQEGDEWVLYYDPDYADSLRVGVHRILAVHRRENGEPGERGTPGVYIDAQDRTRNADRNDSRSEHDSRPDRTGSTSGRGQRRPGSRRSMSQLIRENDNNRGQGGEAYAHQEWGSGRREVPERLTASRQGYAGRYRVPRAGEQDRLRRQRRGETLPEETPEERRSREVPERRVDIRDQRGDRQQLIEVKNYLRYNSNYVDEDNRTVELFVRLEGESKKSGEGAGVSWSQIGKDWHLKRNKQRAGYRVDVIWIFTGAKPSNLLRSTLTGAGFTVIVLS